jgi:phospholipid/cholesterol/gamma-HCH transport system substrate-binding protein
MEKQAPSVVRILIAAGFTLSCLGLMLFLWIAFGGAIPLAPESYRFTAYFPEATALAKESDVRIGGVTVGKVKDVGLAPSGSRLGGKEVAAAEIEIEPEYAPISEDARAILRQKTVVGETYVELTAGTDSDPGEGEVLASISHGEAVDLPEGVEPAGDPLEEGASLGVQRTQEATQIDEIFNGFDEETRTAFQRWQQQAAVAIKNRDLALNDALGNLAPFVTDASDTLEILAGQEEALRALVRDTGITFEALSERREELTEAIRGQRNTFEGLAAEDEALAETFQILPTFQRETRATMERLEQFRTDADPLFRDLIPVARELSPTLRNVRRLTPNLRDLFADLDVLYDVSLDGLPALRDVLDGLRPVLIELDPFLANINPLLRYLTSQKGTVTDFLTGPSVSLAGAADGLPDDPAPRHFLRQLSVLGTESTSIWPNRLPTNRGHGYVADGVLNGFEASQNGIFPNFDCKNTDYEPGGEATDPDADEADEDFVVRGESNPEVNSGNPPDARYAPCFIQGPWPDSRWGGFGTGRAPTLFADP